MTTPNDLERRLAAAEQRQEAIQRNQEMILSRPAKPVVIDLGELRAASEKYAKPEPEAPTSTVAHRPSPEYVNGDGEVYNRRTREWVARSAEEWERRQRWSDAPVLQVGDPGGRTVVSRNGRPFIRRGCLIDGHPELVWDKVAVGKWEAGPWTGGLCIVCHQWWTEAEIATRTNWDGLALFVTSRLQDEGYIEADAELARAVEEPGGHTRIERFHLRDWASKTWAFRVLRSDRPEVQEPPRQSFGYLAGPLRLAEPEGVRV